MKREDFETTITIDKTAREVFNGINNVRGWWSANIEGSTSQLNSEFIYRDKYVTAKMRITQLSTQKIVWDVLETNNEFFDHKTEWDGTKIIFQIIEKDGQTELTFTHLGLVPEFECFAVCSNSWDFFITTSLKNLIETGKGGEISKDENSYNTSVLLDKSPQEVFDAINNVKAWWSENIKGKTDELGADFFYHHQDIHLSKIKIVNLNRYDKIVWFIKDNFFNFTNNKAEWKGTKIVFDILRKDGKTQLIFTHHGLTQEYECYEVCKNAWGKFIEESLFDFITTGQGEPTSKHTNGFDVKFIENWQLRK